MAGFNHIAKRNEFLADYHRGQFSNNSKAEVTRVNGLWRLIGIHHLTGEENASKHNLYFDAINEAGERQNVKIKWGWVGQRPYEVVQPVSATDKPPNEPGGNISLGGGQVAWAEVMGEPSDRISNVSTGLEDENWGNTWGHHSYYCVWLKTETPLPEPDARNYETGFADGVRYARQEMTETLLNLLETP